MVYPEIFKYRSYQGGYFQTIIEPGQSNNALAIVEFTLPKGAEPPPHIHTNEDETFYVLAGEIIVRLKDDETLLRQGKALFAPKGIPHSFRIVTEKAVFLNLISPGMLWNYFMKYSAPVLEPPATISLTAPPPQRIKEMIDTITNDYKVNFL